MSAFGFSMVQHSERRKQEAVFDRTFHGVIAGVEFDLRHHLLPPEKWACPHLVTTPPPSHPGFHIVSAPATADDQWFGGSLIELQRMALTDARAKGLDILHIGDVVKAEGVEILAASEDKFASEPDRHAAHVRLIVARRDGTEEDLHSMYLWPRGSFSGPFNEWETLARLSDRVQSLDATADELRSMSTRLGDLKRGLERVLWELPALPGQDGLTGLGGPWPLTIDLDQLVNLAALYGHRQGRAEVEQEMREAAEAKLAHDEQARSAGAGNRDQGRAGFARRFWADSPEATIYAAVEAYRNEDPSSSESSVRRSFEAICPSTSPSYHIAQANILKRRNQAAQRHSRSVGR